MFNLGIYKCDVIAMLQIQWNLNDQFLKNKLFLLVSVKEINNLLDRNL